MTISLIAAMAENRVIGRNGAVPWDIPSDRKRFRELTMGHPLIMGRTTFESIGRPLPGRTTIIISRQQGYRVEGCSVAPDLPSALALCADAGEVFICGGSEVYGEAIHRADRIYLTIVHGEFSGDASFPAIPGDFVEAVREGLDSPLPCTFVIYERRRMPCRCDRP